jgi:hypothetical protein
MDRRAALARMVAITGGAMIGSEFFLSGCRRADKQAARPFTPEDLAFLDEIGDTIIPATDTPGAKAVRIGAFMTTIVNDCYDNDSHAIFQRGLTQIDAASNKRYGKPFVRCAPPQRVELLNALDGEQRAYTKQKSSDDPPHYFRLMKDLTLLGYFTSEIGCTKALRYIETPGSYNGDVPYKKGDRAWVNPMRGGN